MNDFTVIFDYDNLLQKQKNFLDIKKLDYCGN
jgi:hypothetical protein